MKTKEYCFRKEVEKRLIDLDMTKSDLANTMGISLAYLSGIMRGYRNPESRIKQIKEILGL